MSEPVKSWADAENDLPSTQITENPDGTRTVVSYKINEAGKKVKVTQKIKLVKVTEKVDSAIAARKKWARYGDEKNNKTIGPDNSTTQLGEEVKLILGTTWKQDSKKEAEQAKKEMAKTRQSTVKCRICQGEHFTSKCPYKDTLGAESATSIDGDQASTPEPISASAAGSSGYVPPHLRGTGASAAGAGSGYVPPHMRNRAPGAMPGPGEHRERDDSTTLRVTNLNEQVDEGMLRDQIFAKFGPVVRATVLRNRETRESKGIAFVELETVSRAQAAIDALDGRGFMNLILKVDWSKPKKN